VSGASAATVGASAPATITHQASVAAPASASHWRHCWRWHDCGGGYWGWHHRHHHHRGWW
jgi:Spy/CpxP family protein refolding chaperone